MFRVSFAVDTLSIHVLAAQAAGSRRSLEGASWTRCLAVASTGGSLYDGAERGSGRSSVTRYSIGDQRLIGRPMSRLVPGAA
jgi:hypothetical protein